MIEFMPRVCADFYDKNRNLLFRVTQKDLGNYVIAPDAIEQDPLYRMLLDDGSIKLSPANSRDRRDLENNPYAGADATGREIVAASGGSDGDLEVNRNKRSVRGTVASIEVAEQDIKPKAEKPKAETKPKATAKAPVKTEAKTEEKPADSRPAETK